MSKDIRDLRDPEQLGRAILERHVLGAGFERVTESADWVDRHAAVGNYCDGGHISSNPADHHSKVDQTLSHQEVDPS